MYNLIDSRRRSQSVNRGESYKLRGRSGIQNNILDFIGNTPLVRLNKIPHDHGLQCEIYAKCEFMNPGGSMKDRVAVAMRKDAEQGGNITENTVFVEPTSGNTGIGVAFDAAITGHKSIVITSQKNSDEKANTMRLLGSEVIQTNKSPTQIAHQIHDNDRKHVIILNQFENPVNPKIHYDTTAEEILKELDEVDMLVAGAGTGGSITGIGTKLKERFPKCLVIAAEPDGSTFFNIHGKRHPFLVEGIGGSKVPIVLDKSVADSYEVVTDEESFLMARELARKEGLLCGGSSGTAMAAAVKAARKMNLGVGKRIVVILVDGIRNYMTKFVCDQWMEAHLFIDPPAHTMRWWNLPITILVPPRHVYPIIDTKFTCAEAINEMKEVDVAIVVDDKGFFVGAVSKDGFRNYATDPTKMPGQDSEDFNFNDVVTLHLLKECYTLAENGKKGVPTVGRLSRILDITKFVVIGKNVYKDSDVHFVPEFVATADDVLPVIMNFSH